MESHSSVGEGHATNRVVQVFSLFQFFILFSPFYFVVSAMAQYLIMLPTLIKEGSELGIEDLREKKRYDCHD